MIPSKPTTQPTRKRRHAQGTAEDGFRLRKTALVGQQALVVEVKGHPWQVPGARIPVLPAIAPVTEGCDFSLGQQKYCCIWYLSTANHNILYRIELTREMAMGAGLFHNNSPRARKIAHNTLDLEGLDRSRPSRIQVPLSKIRHGLTVPAKLSRTFSPVALRESGQALAASYPLGAWNGLLAARCQAGATPLVRTRIENPNEEP